MENFTYHVPTKVVFGTDRERKIGELLKEQGATKVLIVHGLQCSACHGLYKRVTDSLEAAGILYNDIDQVAPPPTVDVVEHGVALGRIENVDFVLAVGGWSVVNVAKAIALGIPNDGGIWEYITGKRVATEMLPVGVIVTSVAGAGEMSGLIRLENTAERRRRSLYLCDALPKLAVVNPMLTYTLPMEDIQGGVARIMMLIMAHYFPATEPMELTNNLAESLLRVLVRNAPIVLEEPNNYEARANIMWASALTYNNLVNESIGEADFTVHTLERELVSMHGVGVEGMGMAALWCAWARFMYVEHWDRLYRYGRTVWNLPRDFGSKEAIAMESIRLTEQFFEQIGMLGEAAVKRFANEDFDIEVLTERTMEGKETIGVDPEFDYQDVAEIFKQAIGRLQGV